MPGCARVRARGRARVCIGVHGCARQCCAALRLTPGMKAGFPPCSPRERLPPRPVCPTHRSARVPRHQHPHADTAGLGAPGAGALAGAPARQQERAPSLPGAAGWDAGRAGSLWQACRAMPCHTVLYCAMPCCEMSCCAMPCHAVLYCAMPCCAGSHHVTLCCAVPCCAVPCQVVPCCAMPFCFMLC